MSFIIKELVCLKQFINVLAMTKKLHLMVMLQLVRFVTGIVWSHFLATITPWSIIIQNGSTSQNLAALLVRLFSQRLRKGDFNIKPPAALQILLSQVKTVRFYSAIKTVRNRMTSQPGTKVFCHPLFFFLLLQCCTFPFLHMLLFFYFSSFYLFVLLPFPNFESTFPQYYL